MGKLPVVFTSVIYHEHGNNEYSILSFCLQMCDYIKRTSLLDQF